MEIFLYPPGINQIIVILYRDENSSVRYPGLFALINNKKYEVYIYLFENIKFLISLENTIDLKFNSYIIDFEKAFNKKVDLVMAEAALQNQTRAGKRLLDHIEKDKVVLYEQIQ